MIQVFVFFVLDLFVGGLQSFGAFPGQFLRCFANQVPVQVVLGFSQGDRLGCDQLC